MKEAVSNPRLKRANRSQLIFRTIHIDKLIEEDHPMRAIMSFLERLDLNAFYQDIEVQEGAAGRSATDPQILIAIWIYAYSQGVSSARQIERLCEYHPAYQWLVAMEIINHHTLSNFRIKHSRALDNLFTEVLGILSAENLIILERVMHDGTKIKAQAGKDSFQKEDRIQAHLKMARDHIEHMKNSKEETLKTHKIRERLLREKKERLESALRQLQKIRAIKPTHEAKQQAKVSMTDPESRIMKQPNGGFDTSYNVQISTDAHAGIIVGIDPSQDGYDYDQLTSAVERVEENMKRSPRQMIADGGYINRENIVAMSQKGIDFIGPSTYDPAEHSSVQSQKRRIDPAFYRDRFEYCPDNNVFICPVGTTLKYHSKQVGPAATVYRYQARSKDCQACFFKDKCCPKNPAKGRCVSRTEYIAAITSFVARMKTDEVKDIYRQRASVAEFTNAWIKDKLGLRQFRLRGLIKVRMECLWASITYNIQQWIRLRWRVQPAL
jgi:transposase